MSTVVCHMQKYNKAAVGGIQHEDWHRDKNNPNLDMDRTDDNFHFAPAFESRYDEHVPPNVIPKCDGDLNILNSIKCEMSQLNQTKALRKDAIVCASFIIGSDKEFFDNMSKEDTQKYFQDVYMFFQEKYKSNVLGGSVHLDEGTPHMHLRIFPKTEDGRLCCKEVFDRKALQAIQKELPQYLRERGHAIEEPNHGAKRKHRNEVEQRLYASEKALEQAEQRLEHANNTLKQVEEIKQRVDVLLEATEHYHEQIQNVLEHTGIGRNKTLDQNRSLVSQERKDIDVMIAQAKEEWAKQPIKPRLPKAKGKDQWSR